MDDAKRRETERGKTIYERLRIILKRIQWEWKMLRWMLSDSPTVTAAKKDMRHDRETRRILNRRYADKMPTWEEFRDKH